MFKTKGLSLNDASNAVYRHTMLVNRMNIYFLNIRLIARKYRHMDYKTYTVCFANSLSGIALESDPIETVVPYADEETDGFKNDRDFYLNYETPEAKAINELLTEEVVRDTLLPDSELLMKFINNEVSLADIIDDVYLHYIVDKYWQQIAMLRFQAYTNLTPLVEYVSTNITMRDIMNHITTKKVNLDKYIQHSKPIIFNKELADICKIFSNEELMKSIGSKPFKFDEFIQRLVTNYTIKSDIYIITAIYQTCSIASIEINKPTGSDFSRCVNLVKIISEYMNK